MASNLPSGAAGVCILALVLLGCDAWKICDVTLHGARGDNFTKDTVAIQAAINECSSGGEILLPAPGKYLSGPFNLTSNQLLRVPVGAVLVASQDLRDYPELPAFPSYGIARDASNSTCRYGSVIGAVAASNVTVTGGGVLDGQGWSFWRLRDEEDKKPGSLKCDRPHLLSFESCTQVAVAALTLKDSPFWTSHFIYSQSIYISNLAIYAPAERWNTDGIDIDSSSDVLIEDCFISNGDDGVAIKSGMNQAGIEFGRPSRNITIKNITTRGRGGIAIGSEMSGGVQGVSVFGARLEDWGIVMKTTKGRGGYIQDVIYHNVTASALLYTSYFDGSTNLSGPWSVVRNVSFTNLYGACTIDCGPMPLENCDLDTFHYINACGHHQIAPQRSTVVV